MPSIPLRALPQRVTVERVTGSVDDESGGRTDIWTAMATNVPCQIATQPIRSKLDEGRMAADLVSSAWFTPTTDVKGGDRLLVTAGPGTGSAWRVDSVTPQAMGVYLKAFLTAEVPA